MTIKTISKLENVAKTNYSRDGQDYLFQRFYTQDIPEGKTVYDLFEYDFRTAQISNEKGEIIFEQKNVEVPKHWSEVPATNIVASKYFRRKDVPKSKGGNEDGSEQSIKRLVHRVAHTIRSFGEERGYFAFVEEAGIFEDELTYILLSQRAAFNSPVWFNVGLFHDYGIVEKTDDHSYYWDPKTNSVKENFDSYSHPQASACFINSIEDKLLGPHSIYDLAKIEGKLFKYGSGSGTNWSHVRGESESLSGGGKSSGTVSFMGIMDAGARAVKSGGKTRRAAKMVILNADHPDIEQFIYWKVHGERKARALAAAGYDMNIDALYKEIDGQNSNNSIRVTDDFMKAVLEDKDWNLIGRKDGKVLKTLKARDLFELMVKAAWVSGDPGIQFDTTINKWHTCSNTAPINASNPCAEYMFLDDSACNLASLNLMKYRRENGNFDIESFKHDVRIMITAQEILVDLAGYPTYEIAKNSHDYRPLGLGYANLGAFLMSNGIAYDSEEGRSVAAVITSIMTAESYKQSAKIASRIGPYPGFEKNREPHLRVMKQHYESHKKIQRVNSKINLEEMLEEGDKIWSIGMEFMEMYGARNAQATVLAPTGTIGFMMDCDTTGIEPDIALVKYKKMVGGGIMKLVNKTVPMALKKLGYNDDHIKEIVNYIEKNETIEGAPNIKKEDLSVFDCAFKPFNGERSISPMGHVRMMAAVQPFISGAISKTVNTPEHCTPKDIYDIYLESWKLGLKAISVYRDGSKIVQPLSVGDKKKSLEEKLKRGEERPLPQITDSMTIRLKIKDEHGIEHGIHIICGEYEDGTLGEVRAQMFEEGSTMKGMEDSYTVAVSKGLRFGIPVEEFVATYRAKNPKFPPSGVSNYPYMKSFNSLPHLIWGVVGLEYLGIEEYIKITGEENVRNRVKDPSKLRVNKNKERLRFEMYMKQIKEIDKVMNTPLFDKKSTTIDSINEDNEEIQIIENGNGEMGEYASERKKISNGQTCPNCGFSIPGIVGCTHCPNCFKQISGGCPS